METLKYWTKFRGRPNSYIRSDGLRITINARGNIYMNDRGWETFGRPEAVELMFDVGRRVIGVKSVPAWQPGSFPVRHRKKGGKMIHASPFCVHFALKPNCTAVFNQAHIDEGGILSLPIDSLTASGRGFTEPTRPILILPQLSLPLGIVHFGLF